MRKLDLMQTTISDEQKELESSSAVDNNEIWEEPRLIPLHLYSWTCIQTYIYTPSLLTPKSSQIHAHFHQHSHPRLHLHSSPATRQPIITSPLPPLPPPYWAEVRFPWHSGAGNCSPVWSHWRLPRGARDWSSPHVLGRSGRALC